MSLDAIIGAYEYGTAILLPLASASVVVFLTFNTIAFGFDPERVMNRSIQNAPASERQLNMDIEKWLANVEYSATEDPYSTSAAQASLGRSI